MYVVLYIHMYAVLSNMIFYIDQINYDYFLLMGNNEQACIAYVKTYFASIYSYFNLIVKPRTTVSIQSIDIFKVGCSVMVLSSKLHIVMFDNHESASLIVIS